MFKHFPHNHLVFSVIFSGDRLSCTCTLMWIIKYYDLFMLSGSTSNDIVKFYDSNSKDYMMHTLQECFDLKSFYFYQKIKECNFDERLEKCNKSNFKIKQKNPINDIEFYFDIKWIELIFFVFGRHL